MRNSLAVLTDGFSAISPTHLHFLITGKCNLSCPLCYYKRGGHVDLETVLEVLVDFSENGGKAVAFGGGEPLLYPSIVEVVAGAKENGLYVAITTNATLPIPKWSIAPDRIHFSFDSHHGVRREELNRRLKEVANESVGLNIGLFDDSDFELAIGLVDLVDTITLILPKPDFISERDSVRVVDMVKQRPEKYWLDACLAVFLEGKGLYPLDGSKNSGISRENDPCMLCRQGITSFSLNWELMASRCSNVEHSVEWTNTCDVWNVIRNREERLECIVT